MRARLIIGPDGEVALPPRQAEALGLPGGGEVDVVGARGSFALVLPARADAPKAWFAGSLAALTVAEVVQFVFSSLKTGVLLLSFGDREGSFDRPEQLRRKSIHFRDGQVVFASSSDPADRLGPILVANGLASEGDVERCTRLVRSGRRRLGQVLVDEGILTAGQLYEAITLQVKEIFLGCFVETEGEFAFVEGGWDEQNQVKLPERTRDLILQGMKRLEAAEQRRAGSRPPEPAEPEGPALTPPPARPKERAVSGPFETYRRILARVHRALAAVEPDAARRLNSWFDRLPERRHAIFDGVRIGDGGELDVARVLANVTAAGAYRGAAARARALEALEELLAFALFEAKNRLPKAEAEKLLREVGRMQVGKA